ncbi:hypothetical protein [Pandoraea sp. CB10b_02]|uniref:hypothetical protein n=1 Tax=Pandoraea sp. CB10b_02 TaxID=2014535 RepID=UPI00257C84BB|nr:hypothetical protein [Pandoraea sp. CB10b_02]
MRTLAYRLRRKWQNRKTYKEFSAMPTALVVFFALVGYIEAGYVGFALSEVLPGYLRTANTIPLDAWGWQGWLVLFLLGGLGLYVWVFGSMAVRCNAILQERLFK